MDSDLRAPGQYTDRSDGFNLSELVAHGYEWMSYQVYNPNLPTWRVDFDLAPAKAAGFKSTGVWVCTYGNGNNPDPAIFKRDGIASGQQAVKLGAEHLHVDAEFCAKNTRQNRGLKPFVDGCREGGWFGPIHLNTLGAPVNGIPHGPNDFAIDHKSFLDTGGGVIVQAYANAYAEYEPSLCVDYWKACGVPADKINVVIEMNTAEGTVNESWDGSEWLPHLEKAGVKRNFSIFMAQFCKSADLVALDKLTKQAPTPAAGPSAKDCRANIVLESEKWLSTQSGQQPKSRLRVIHRIAGGSNVDAKWTTVDDQIVALLDKAGIGQ